MEEKVVMGYKSRGNYNIGRNVSQEEWDKIFGKKEEKPEEPTVTVEEEIPEELKRHYFV